MSRIVILLFFKENKNGVMDRVVFCRDSRPKKSRFTTKASRIVILFCSTGVALSAGAPAGQKCVCVCVCEFFFCFFLLKSAAYLWGSAGHASRATI